MLSFRQLSEKKTKIKINPKKDEIVEGQKKKKDDSYLETNMKKRQANNEKARKDLMKGPQMKNPHFESTEDAYDSQEEVSEESNQEIEAETEIPFLTFNQYQYARTLSEEQLDEFLGSIFKSVGQALKGVRRMEGGGSKQSTSSAPPAKPASALQGVMTGAGASQGSRSMMGRAGQAGAPMNKPPISNSAISGRPSPLSLKQSKPKEEKLKKEEVEQVSEFNLGALFGGGKKANPGGAAKPSPSQAAVGALQNQARQGNLMGNGMIANTAQKMMNRRDQQAAMMKQLLGRSKGGKIPAKVKKEEVGEIDEMSDKLFNAVAGNNKMLKQTIKPGGNNSLGVRSAATSAGGGKYFTNNGRMLARMPGTYIRGNVPEPPKTAPKVNSSANAVRPGMGSSSSNVRASSSSGPRPNRPVTASNAMRNRQKREHHLRSFGSFLNERTRYAKETGKDFTTGNPSEKGGEGRSEVGKHMQKIMRPTGGAMSSRKKAIQPQGKKKEKGKKGYEGVTPVDKIKNKLSRKRAPKKDPYGYGQGRYQGD